MPAKLQGLYGFTDALPENKAFYRIKSIDRDAAYSYSVVVSYSQGLGRVRLAVFPSPATGSINIQHPAATASTKIIIAATDGRILQTIFPASGLQKTATDISRFPNGTFVVRFYSDKHAAESATFVKQ